MMKRVVNFNAEYFVVRMECKLIEIELLFKVYKVAPDRDGLTEKRRGISNSRQAQGTESSPTL